MGLASLAKAPNLLSEGGRAPLPEEGGSCRGRWGSRKELGKKALPPVQPLSRPGLLVPWFPLSTTAYTHSCMAGLNRGHAHSRCLINGDS